MSNNSLWHHIPAIISSATNREMEVLYYSSLSPRSLSKVGKLASQIPFQRELSKYGVDVLKLIGIQAFWLMRRRGRVHRRSSMGLPVMTVIWKEWQEWKWVLGRVTKMEKGKWIFDWSQPKLKEETADAEAWFMSRGHGKECQSGLMDLSDHSHRTAGWKGPLETV